MSMRSHERTPLVADEIAALQLSSWGALPQAKAQQHSTSGSASEETKGDALFDIDVSGGRLSYATGMADD